MEQWLAKRADVREWEELASKWEQASAVMTMPVEDLVLPLEHYDSGRVQTVLRAERGHLLKGEMEGLVFARNVKMERLRPDGKPEGMLIAEDCLIDRNTKLGYARGAVEVKTGTDQLKGRGMYFSTDDQFIKLLSECEIRTFRIPARFGRL